MAETPQDVVNRELREFKRYTGDGLPGEPVNAPLPVGDPQSGVHNPKKVNLRNSMKATLEGAAQSASDAKDEADRAKDEADRAEDARDLSEQYRDTALDHANDALSSKTQAELAALAAGAPLYTSEPDLGTAPSPYLLQVEAGTQVYTHDGTDATMVGWLGKVEFPTVAALLAFAGPLGPEGTTITAQGFRYEVAASDATDYHVETAGGVRLKKLPMAFSGIDASPMDMIWTPRPALDFNSYFPGYNRTNFPYSALIDKWEELRAAHPQWITRDNLGMDESETYTLWSYVFTPENGYDRTVVVDAGIHGSEVMNQLCCYLFFVELAETWGRVGALAAARHRVRWVVVPCANPWGMDQSPKKRQNSNGVDINRNWGYRWDKFTTGGTDPFDIDYKGPVYWSEAETRILRDLVDVSYPDAVAVVSLHDFGSPIPTVLNEAVLYTPEFVVPNDRWGMMSHLRRLEQHGITVSPESLNGLPNSFNYHGRLGRNSGNPEWAFRFSGSLYGSEDVTAALTFYGNVMLAFAFARPAAAVEILSPKVIKFYQSSLYDVPMGDSLEDWHQILPDFEVDSRGLTNGFARLDVTVVMSNWHATRSLYVNTRPGFGQDSATRDQLRASQGGATNSNRTLLRPITGGIADTKTVSASYVIPYMGHNNAKIRVIPRIAYRDASGATNDGTSPLSVQWYGILTLIPSDGREIYDIRTASNPSSSGWAQSTIMTG